MRISSLKKKKSLVLIINGREVKGCLTYEWPTGDEKQHIFKITLYLKIPWKSILSDEHPRNFNENAGQENGTSHLVVLPPPLLCNNTAAQAVRGVAVALRPDHEGSGVSSLGHMAGAIITSMPERKVWSVKGSCDQASQEESDDGVI